MSQILFHIFISYYIKILTMTKKYMQIITENSAVEGTINVDLIEILFTNI